MKYAKILPIAVTLISLMSASAVNAELKMDTPTVTGNEFMVNGDSGSQNAYVTFLAAKIDGENEDILTVGQVECDAEGKFVTKFAMDDNQNGKYKVRFHLNNSSEYSEVEFIYVNDDIKNQLLNDLQTKTAADIETELSRNENYQNALEDQGMSVEDFLNLDKAKRIEYISDIGNSIKSLKEFADELNIRLSFHELNEKKDIYKNLSRINLTFEEKSFNEFEENEKNKIALITEKRLPVENIAKLKETYYNCVVLTKLNMARYSDINLLMNTYKDNLELNNNTDYSTYLGFSEKNKQSVQEIIVQKLSTNNAYTNDEYKAVLTAAVTAVKNNNSSSGGGNGGGSGSGGNRGTSKNAYNEISVPNGVTALEADTDQTQFSDIDDVLWAKKEILYLAKKGIVSGKEKGKYMPNDTITREEFTKMIVDAANIHDTEAVCNFSDVVKGSWYESYVASAYKNGFVLGQSDEIFGIGNAITREDVCVIASKLIKDKNSETELEFSDAADISDYAIESVKLLTGKGIISGMGNNEFKPKYVCTRAQAAKILYGILTEENV